MLRRWGLAPSLPIYGLHLGCGVSVGFVYSMTVYLIHHECPSVQERCSLSPLDSSLNIFSLKNVAITLEQRPGLSLVLPGRNPVPRIPVALSGSIAQ